MPTSIVGFALFLFLLAPGLCFFLIRTQRKPQRAMTVLQETGAVVLMSALCLTITAMLFACFHLVFSAVRAPNFSAVVGTPHKYAKEHPMLITLWGASFLAVACALGSGLSFLEVPNRFRFRSRYSPDSAWSQLLLQPTDVEVYGVCHAADGSAVGGFVGSASPQFDETGDRDLVLVPPITRWSGKESMPVLDQTLSAVVLSARDIVRLDVSYLAPGTAEKARSDAGLEGRDVDISDDPPSPDSP